MDQSEKSPPGIPRVHPQREAALAHARRAAEYAHQANLIADEKQRAELLQLRQAALRMAAALGMPMHEAIAVSRAIEQELP